MATVLVMHDEGLDQSMAHSAAQYGRKTTGPK